MSDTAALDAELLVAKVLGVKRAWVLAHPEAGLTVQQGQTLGRDLARLEAGEPLPYVLGHWEFYGLDFSVGPAVLIPRPETELLVEHALTWLQEHPERRLVADIGTGSGCIAISLAYHTPGLQVAATDLSVEALQVAEENAGRHHVAQRIRFLQADLLPDAAQFPQQFDALCANLPYIPGKALPDLRVARREPHLALDGGPDGLDVIRRLLEQAPARLSTGGLVLLEIEASQGYAAQALAVSAFPQARVQVLQDLAGHDRLVRVDV